MSEFVTINGEFCWARLNSAETDPWGNTKYKTGFLPDAEDMPKVLDLQARGCRNQLKKNEDGRYIINFSRDAKFGPPKVYQADGVTEYTGLFSNGTKGSVKIEIRQFKSPQGQKGHSARLHSAMLTDIVPYEPKKPSQGGF